MYEIKQSHRCYLLSAIELLFRQFLYDCIWFATQSLSFSDFMYLLFHFSITINVHPFFPSLFIRFHFLLFSATQIVLIRYTQTGICDTSNILCFFFFFLVLFPFFLLLLLLLLPTLAFPFQHTLWVVFNRTLF